MVSSPSARQQRFLVLTTVVLAGVTFVLGGIGVGTSAEFAARYAENEWAWTDLVFTAAGLLAFSQPLTPPDTVSFALAQLTSVLFALSAGGTILFVASGTVRRSAALLAVRRRSERDVKTAHTIIVGVSGSALQLVDDVVADGRDVIVLTGDVPARQQRDVRNRGAHVLSEDPRQPSTWHRARLTSAREVFLVDSNDAVNLDLAEDVIRGFPLPRGVPYVWRDPRLPGPHVYVQVRNPAYAALFREHNFFSSTNRDANVHVFDVRERAARDLLLHPDHGLATTHAPGADEVAHYVVVGFGETGQAVALEAARLGHFENRKRLRMTIVDDFRENDGTLGPADAARRQFLARVPTFCPDDLDLLTHARTDDAAKDDWACRDYRPACKSVRRDAPAIEYVVNAEFVDLPADDPDLVEHLFERFTAPGDTPVRPAVVVCFDDEGRNFRTAHRLQSLLYSGRIHERVGDVPIYVYVPAEEGLERLLRVDGPAAEHVPMYSFGRRSRVARHAQITRPKILDLAKSINAGYARKYAPAGEDPASREALWRSLSTAFRFSNEDAAAHAVVKLRTVGYRWRVFDDETDADGATVPASEIEVGGDAVHTLSRMEHNRFVAERLLSGWTYEPLPDGYDAMTKEEREAVKEEMKTRRRRASLVPFEDVPGEDVPKDREQVASVLEALEASGERVERIDADDASDATTGGR